MLDKSTFKSYIQVIANQPQFISMIKWGREAKVYTDEGICHFWTLVSSQNHRLYIFFFLQIWYPKLSMMYVYYLQTISWIYSPEILNSSFQCLLNYHIIQMGYDAFLSLFTFWKCLVEAYHFFGILRVIVGWSILQNYPTHIILYPTSASKRTHGNLSFLGCLEESIE